jgi:glycine C-acetyltransferase
VATSVAIFDLLTETTELRDKLEWNTLYFRKNMAAAGFDIPKGEHPICAIMLGKFPNDAKLSQDMARDLLEEGIYVIGFYYPVVAKGASRIRVQISAAHDKEDLDKAIAAFTKVAKKYGVIN